MPASVAADLADQFLICIEGSIVLSRIFGDPGYLRRGVAQFRRCLEKAGGRPPPAWGAAQERRLAAERAPAHGPCSRRKRRPVG